jgi:epoxide hydrolase 4
LIAAPSLTSGGRSHKAVARKRPAAAMAAWTRRVADVCYGRAMPFGVAARVDESTLAHKVAVVDGGVGLHYVEVGAGPLVVLLHGFPEFWYTWRCQIGGLAAAGFRVVAPDQRGYNLSDKPPGVGAYGVRHLADDVAALIRACGETKASVVGHDWGAGVAWAFAMSHPEMLARIAVLNGPHPERMIRGLRDPRQLAKSWYMFMFQVPGLPELLAERNGYEFLLAPLRSEPTNPEAFSGADLARYAEAFARPGAVRAMINWYRALFRPNTAVAMRRVDAPALVLWGTLDRHLGRELATPSPSLVPNVKVDFLSGASHWTHHDEPARVNDALTAFLRGP